MQDDKIIVSFETDECYELEDFLANGGQDDEKFRQEENPDPNGPSYSSDEDRLKFVVTDNGL